MLAIRRVWAGNRKYFFPLRPGFPNLPLEFEDHFLPEDRMIRFDFGLQIQADRCLGFEKNGLPVMGEENGTPLETFDQALQVSNDNGKSCFRSDLQILTGHGAPPDGFYFSDIDKISLAFKASTSNHQIVKRM